MNQPTTEGNPRPQGSAPLSSDLHPTESALSIVIPVFNAEPNLRRLVAALTETLEGEAHEFEIILVEDCGNDRSWEIIQQLASEDSRLRGIRLSRNFGQHNALLCGIRAAKNPTIVTMDDDLQHPPEAISTLLHELSAGFDVVYGAPVHEQHGFSRDLASKLTKLVLQKAMGAETARHISAFRVFRTRLREAFASYQGPTVSIDVLLTWATARFSVVRVPHRPREAGVSNYTVGKLLTHAFNMLTGFSAIPLQIATWVGFAFTLFGFAILLYVVFRFLILGSVVPGFPFLASIISIFSGAQLLALGIFGEYLSRIHFRTMSRPAYVVAEECQSS